MLSREGHLMGLDGVSLDLNDEVVVVLGAGYERAVALKHLLHDLAARHRKERLDRGMIQARHVE